MTTATAPGTIVLLFLLVGFLDPNPSSLVAAFARTPGSLSAPHCSATAAAVWRQRRRTTTPVLVHRRRYTVFQRSMATEDDENTTHDAAEKEETDEEDDDEMAWLQGPPADGEEQQGPEIIECDVGIIGGGPAGCTCALYTSRADLKTVLVDKNEVIGALAITSHIANYPGVDRSMSGLELLQQMKTQAREYGTHICDRAQVFMVDIQTEDDDEENEEDNDNEEEAATTTTTGPKKKKKPTEKPYNKIVYTPDYTIKARSLVLATGAMGRSMPYLPGEEKYLGQGVSYCATCDGAFYRNAEVAVFGATGEALEEAVFLTKFAKTVHWITPIDVVAYLERLDAAAAVGECAPDDAACISHHVEMNALFDEATLRDFLAQPNVQHHNKARLLAVEGEVSGVTGVRTRALGTTQPEDEVVIPVEGAFIYGAGGGSKPITDFLAGSGIAVDTDGGGGALVDAQTMESLSHPGIFAIGDIRDTPYKQVVVAAADGCVAAMSIEKYLKGRKTIKVDWIHK